ncbi:MAG: hypothetical protein ACJAZX_000402 [Rickettsiales bacterium]|jgi:hypothetical protein
MPQNYYCIITDKGLEKEAASKLENSAPLSLAKIAVGDGGGAYYDPTSAATALVNECYRTKDEHPINVVVDDNHPNQVIIEGLIPEDTDGKSFYIREVGVFDSDGDLFAIGKYPETYKTHISEGSNKRLYVRMILAFVTKLNVEVRVSQDINLDPNFASNIRNELANRLKISENFADLSNDEIARNNLDVHSKGAVDDALNTKLKKSSNLSDLTSFSDSRNSLSVYSQTEINEKLDRKSEKSENLSDLTDKSAARTNLDIYNKSEIDGKINAKLEASSNLSDLASLDTARNNLNIYSAPEVDLEFNLVYADIDDRLEISSNLSDLGNIATARSNLGTYGQSEIDSKVNDKLHKSSNLSDLTDKAAARNNLGLIDTATTDLTGSVTAFATDVIPAGWLKCNGAAISRTTYSKLFSRIGTRYGSGDGSNSFNIPDLRGEFIRGWDDGRGVDSGRGFASSQAEEVGTHNHNFIDGRGYLVPRSIAGKGREYGQGGIDSHIVFDALTGNETRPRNIALIYCIKY